MEKLDFNKEWFWKRIGDAQRETQAEMKVNIPHDAMLREARRADCPGGKNTGYFEGADYLYTKNFSVPAEWKQKKLILEFEGIYHHAEVYINGIKAVYRPFGYTNFYIDLNSFLNYGKDNQIQVFAKNSEQPNSRWYTGAGIYRPVWLWFGEKEYILPSGVKIDTVSITPPVVRFSLKTFGSGSMELTILNDKEEVVVKQQWNREQRVIQITLPGAHGWSADEPILYKYCLTLKNDKACGYFGIRQLNWDIQGGVNCKQ